MASPRHATVFGAYGHTGQFIVAELRKCGWTPILSGRDAGKLAILGVANPGLEVRPASVDDPLSLDAAVAGAAAVINCAGPFADTASRVIDAALRARIAYVDVTAEVEVVAAAFEQYAGRAADAGIVIAPAMGFYGALGDLLVTAATGDWSRCEVDEICVAYALDSWRPTPGTRATIRTSTERRGGRRLVLSNDRIELRTDRAPIVEWTFPAPFGTQAVMSDYTTAASLAISRHLRTREIRSYMTVAPLKDLSDPDVPPPVGIDESGRSSQVFLIEAVVRREGMERRAVARGRDIYAITAPIAVEAMQRIVGGLARTPGVVTAGAAFDARDFLESLCPTHLSLELSEVASAQRT
jgi:hypothetical protein